MARSTCRRVALLAAVVLLAGAPPAAPAGPVDAPDLTVAVSAPATAVAGTTLTVGYVLDNRGTRAARDFVVAIRLRDGYTMVNLSEFVVAFLAAGASTSGSVLVTLPVRLVQGPWQLHVRVDSGNRVAEIDETNNVARRTLEIASDLDDAMLTWDPSDEPSVAGYRVYVGTAPGRYRRVLDAGLQTEFRIGNLVRGTTYYFAVAAYDALGNESPPSDEVSKLIP